MPTDINIRGVTSPPPPPPSFATALCPLGFLSAQVLMVLECTYFCKLELEGTNGPSSRNELWNERASSGIYKETSQTSVTPTMVPEVNWSNFLPKINPWRCLTPFLPCKTSPSPIEQERKGDLGTTSGYFYWIIPPG